MDYPLPPSPLPSIQIVPQAPSSPLPDSESARSTHTIKKLVSMLGAVRQQSEGTILTLKKELQASVITNDGLRDIISEKNMVIEQMKLEMGKKWRIEERDDWKALVESLQGDRRRLEGEVAALRKTLEGCKCGCMQGLVPLPIEIPDSQLDGKAAESGEDSSSDEGDMDEGPEEAPPQRKRRFMSIVGNIGMGAVERLWPDKSENEVTDEDSD